MAPSVLAGLGRFATRCKSREALSICGLPRSSTRTSAPRRHVVRPPRPHDRAMPHGIDVHRAPWRAQKTTRPTSGGHLREPRFAGKWRLRSTRFRWSTTSSRLAGRSSRSRGGWTSTTSTMEKTGRDRIQGPAVSRMLAVVRIYNSTCWKGLYWDGCRRAAKRVLARQADPDAFPRPRAGSALRRTSLATSAMGPAHLSCRLPATPAVSTLEQREAEDTSPPTFRDGLDRTHFEANSLGGKAPV